MEKFIELMDTEYKKKIQFQLDKMMDKKNGKEKDMPYIKPENNKDGE